MGVGLLKLVGKLTKGERDLNKKKGVFFFCRLVSCDLRLISDRLVESSCLFQLLANFKDLILKIR